LCHVTADARSIPQAFLGISVRDFRFSKNPTREKNRALVGYHKELFLVGNATRGLGRGHDVNKAKNTHHRSHTSKTTAPGACRHISCRTGHTCLHRHLLDHHIIAMIVRSYAYAHARPILLSFPGRGLCLRDSIRKTDWNSVTLSPETDKMADVNTTKIARILQDTDEIHNICRAILAIASFCAMALVRQSAFVLPRSLPFPLTMSLVFTHGTNNVRQN